MLPFQGNYLGTRYVSLVRRLIPFEVTCESLSQMFPLASAP